MLSARHCAARGTGTTEQAGVQGAGGSLRPAPRKSRGAGCYQSRTRGATVMGRRRPCSRVSALPVEKSSAQEVGPPDFAWLHHGTGFLIPYNTDPGGGYDSCNIFSTSRTLFGRIRRLEFGDFYPASLALSTGRRSEFAQLTPWRKFLFGQVFLCAWMSSPQRY